MKRILPFIIVFALSFLCGLSQAEEPSGTDQALQPALSGTVYQADYRIGAGDTLYIEDSVMGKLVENGQVLSDGNITLPLIGKTSLEGLSIPEAKQVLSEKYAHYFKNPNIRLQVLNQRPPRIYITGAVAHPGVYVSGKNLSPDNLRQAQFGKYDNMNSYYQIYLADALMLSGGLNRNANIRDIRIIRKLPQPVTIHVNLMDLFANGSLIQDIPLRDQDVVEVESLPANALVMDEHWEKFSLNNINRNAFTISVLGAVSKPGRFEVEARDNVLTAIAKAGGFEEFANKDKIYVLRMTNTGQAITRELNLKDKDFIGKKPFETWAALLPNDVVFVDDSTGKKAAHLGRDFADRASSSFFFPMFNRLFNGN